MRDIQVAYPPPKTLRVYPLGPIVIRNYSKRFEISPDSILPVEEWIIERGWRYRPGQPAIYYRPEAWPHP